MTEQLNIVVSFSGGRTSAYMLWRLLKEYPNATFYVVFANTGKEEEGTLWFVNECAKQFGIEIHWIEALVTPEKGIGTSYTPTTYETASRKGEPFIAVMEKYGLPTPSFPHCSRELKIVPIQKWINDHVIGDYQMAIGIRYDEQDRVGDYWYPLVDWKVTKGMVREFWRNMPFDLPISDYQGNCDLCWKKSLNKKLTMIEESPERLTWWKEAESTFGNGHLMSRGNVSYERMGELVQRGKFRRAIDGEKIQNPGLFDLELSCTCGVPD